jgi:hypothetical protein
MNFQSIPNDEFEELYKKCKTTNILCYALPSNCMESKTCELILGINSNGYVGSNGTVEFELIGKVGEDMDQWIATGLSDDDKMGNDSVVECLIFKNGTTLFRNSWNSQFSNYVINDIHGIVVSGYVSYHNGLISCKWLRMPYTKVNGMTFNIVDNQYYILLAKGKLADEETGNLIGIIKFQNSIK